MFIICIKMERVIRIQSQQSGDFNFNNNLVDFIIPPAQYNMRDSYLELLAIVSSSDGGVYPVQMNYTATGETESALTAFVPNSKWIRRSRVRSTRQGILEEIQDNDILRQNLAVYTKGLRQTADSMFRQGSQVEEVARSQRDGIFVELRKLNSLASSYKTTPLNIPLKEICEIGGMPVCPVDTMGGLHINLELNAGDRGDGVVGNWNVVGLASPLEPTGSIAGDLEGTSNLDIRSYGNAGDLAGILINRTAGAVKPGSADMPITLEKHFADREDCPFFVGQRLCLTGTPTGGAPALGTKSAIISKMTWNTTTGTHLAPLDSLTIEFADATNGFDNVPAGDSYTTTSITPNTLATMTTPPTFSFRIITANLVLKQITRPQKIGGSFSYTSWESERFAQTSASRLQQTFLLPPNCVSAMVVFPRRLDGYSMRADGAHLRDFRVRINNIDVVNRPVIVANDDTEDEGAGVRSGQYAGLIEQFCRQAGLPLRNLSEIALNSTVSSTTLGTQLDGKTDTRTQETAIIAFPCNETAGMKNMELIVDSFGNTISEVIVYKQVVRTINL